MATINIFRSFNQLSKRIKYSCYIALLLATYSFLGFVALPWWGVNYAPALISEQIDGRPVAIQKIEINPFKLSLKLHQLRITGKNERLLVGIDYLHVNFQMESLFTGVFTFDEFTARKPYAHISILKNNLLNIQDLLTVEDSEPVDAKLAEAASSEEQAIPQLLIHKLTIDSANIQFSDHTKTPIFQADIGPLNINLSNFTTEREKNSPYKLKAESGGGVIGSTLEWEGYLTINPLKSKGKLLIDDVNLQKLASYVREQFEFDIQKGLLSLEGNYDFDFSGNQPLLDILQGSISVRDLHIGRKDHQETLLKFPNIALKGIDYSLQNSSIILGHVKISDGDYSVRLNKQGKINLESLFVTESGQQVVESDSAKTVADNETDEKPFSFSLKHLQLENNAIRVFDLSPKNPMGIDFSHLNLSLRNISLDDNNLMTIDLAGKLGKGNEKGDLALSGEIIAFPTQKINVKLDLKNQPLKHFQPYIKELADIKVRSGYASLTGNLLVDIEGDNQPKIIFDGDINVSKVSITENNVRKKLLSLKSFNISKLHFNSVKNTIKAKRITLNTPEIWSSLDAKGRLNFQKLIRDEASSKGAQEVSPSPIIRLGQLTLQNAKFHYQDYSVEPLFSLGISQLSGRIKNISSQNNSKSDIQLSGLIDDYAPLTFNGKLNVLSDQLYSDVSLGIKNLNMTSFSSYSGVYAGKEIAKGQLNLDVSYYVENDKLQAKNAVFIDQFNFGDKVESEQATKLPVGLGVALLKNQKGEIHIDLPIDGDLNDPDFRYGKLAWKAVGNILLKAAASPFKLLAGLVNTDDDLSHVSFEASASLLTPENIDKLVSLESALLKRPDLKLDIEACFNTSIDSPPLQLKAVQVSINPENKVLTRKQYQRLLAKKFKQQFAIKPEYPAHTKAMDKQARLEQNIAFLEARLMSKQVISIQQLQALALERGSAIRSQLLSSGGISPSRLFSTAIIEKPDEQAIHCHLIIH